MPAKKLFQGMLAVLFLSCGNIPCAKAGTYGALDHQEKADVLFRNLAVIPKIPVEVHSGIYEKYFTGDPDNPFNHLVFQMTGVVTSKLCLDDLFGCVETVRGIEPILLSTFKTVESPYYGAFALASSPGRAERQAILEEAKRLRAMSIDYIVMPDEGKSNLLNHYVRYTDFNSDGIMQEGEITRMRSDAFVEYSYAVAGFPIMDVDITSAAGIYTLQFRSGMQLLFPSDQQARMVSATIQKPELHVYEDETNKELLNDDFTSKQSFHVYVEDLLSGPGRLEIWDKEPSPAGTPNSFLHYFFDNIGHNYNSADFSALGNLPEGKWWIRAIDQAGNWASVDFTISDDKTPPQITVYDYGNKFSVVGDSPIEAAPWLVALSTPVFSFSDSGSGLSWYALYDADSGEMLRWEFFDETSSATAEIYLPNDRAGYQLVVADNADNQSSMYFSVDRHEPKIEYSDIKIKPFGDYYSADVSGTATDLAAGIGAGPVMLANPPMYGDLGVHPTGNPYPPGPLTSTFSYTNLTGSGFMDYMFLAADKANNLGTNELGLSNNKDAVKINTTSGYTEYVNGEWVVHKGLLHLGGVVSGRQILLNSLRLDYPAWGGCIVSGDHSGMSATLSAGGYTPTAQENVSSAWDNVPANFSFPFSTPDPVTGIELGAVPVSASNWVMPQYTYLQLTGTPNTKEMSLTCTTSQGTVTSPIASGTLYYEASVDSTFTLIEAPRVIRQEWVTPDFNVLVKAGLVEVEIDKITVPGKVTVSRAKYDPKVPNFKLAGDKYVYDVNIGAKYEGNVRVTFYLNVAGLSAQQKNGIGIYHNDGSGWKNQTAEVGDDHITYEGATASPFVVLVPMNDTLPPHTSFSAIGAAAAVNNRTYISSTTLVELDASDTALTPDDVSGPATTYYLIDAAPAADCPATPYNAVAGRGTCANPVYAGHFALSEGVHAVSFWSVDNAGNSEAVQSKTLYVDGTAPQAALFADGAVVESSSAAYITDADSITITAIDQESNGVISNVKDVYRFVDVNPVSCGQLRAVVSTAPVGSCQNYLYKGPFRLTVGTHTVYYSAIDNAGNLATGKSAQISVIGSVNSSNLVDGTPEIRFVTPIANASITPVTLGSAQGMAALAAANSQNLLRVSGLYKLGPDGNYPSYSSVTFSYSTATLLAGVPESELAIYARSASEEWIKLFSQTADAANHIITGPVASLASSLFAVLGPKPAVAPVASAFSGVTETGITARWASNGNPSDAGYVAHISTDSGFGLVLLSSETANLSAQFGAGGVGADLVANTTYYFRVKSVGHFNSSSFVVLGSTWTLAFPPSGTATSGIWTTSAAVSWELNGNPEGTMGEVQRSTDNSSYARVFLGSAVSVTDANLKACTTYYYKVRNRNWAGIYSGYDSDTHFSTMGSTPSTAGDFTAESLSGDRIGLSWGFSPSEGVTQYLLYSDAGTGTIDYDYPLVVFGSTVTSWITGALAPATSYKFGLRTKNRCGIEEPNTSVFASATALSSLTGVRAAIKVPQTGKHIQGNSITVVAELLLGEAPQTKQVLFQYRLLGTTTWTDITAVNTNHPNPALDSPYLVHWNVMAFTPGVYELRAVATDTNNTIDAAPPTITVVVDPMDFDIDENSTGGKVEKDQKLDNAVTNTVQAADEGSSLLIKLVIPAGALDTSTVTVTVLNAPAVRPSAPQGAEDLGVIARITLSNSQSQLSGGQTATLTLNYRDDDDNGIVDGTSVKADSLKMYASATSAGPWVLLPSVVDKVKKTVTGTTPHFSFFGVFAAAAYDLSAVRVYPNPYKPNGGNSDEGVPYSAGNPNSGIIFYNLTDRVTIKIYTLTGQLVAKVSSDSSGGKIQWDAKNDSGRKVASGGYVAVITSPGNSDTVRKILIVR